MAKKNTEDLTEEVAEAVEEPVEEQAEKPKKKEAPSEAGSQEEKRVTIRIPRSKEDQGDVFVSVNERTFLIKRGVPVSVPESVAEVLATAERMEDEATEYDLAAQK